MENISCKILKGILFGDEAMTAIITTLIQYCTVNNHAIRQEKSM